MSHSRTVPATPGTAALAFAWTGGAVFVSALAAFLYLYEVRYTHQVASPSMGAFTFDVCLFTVFALHHSLFARTAIKRWLAARLPVWLERSVYTWTASLLLLIVCVLWRAPGGQWYSLSWPWRAVGYGAQAAGLWLTAAASGALDVLDLAGIRQVLAARRGTPPRHVALESRGVYAIVRHPLYLGWALFVSGVPTMTASTAAFAIVSTAYLAIGVAFEERSLIDVFGEEYRQYQRRIRWKMFPGVW